MGNSCCTSRPILSLHYYQEPMVIGGLIHIKNGVRRILSIMQREEFGAAQRRLNRHSAGPDAFADERRRDVCAFSGTRSAIQPGNDGGIQPSPCRMIST